MNVKDIATILTVHGNKLQPCTASEVEALEAKIGLKLPAAYREFLLLMGHGAGKYMLGSDCFYRHLDAIHKGALELIEEHELPEMPPNAFVFWMHQGYMFAYFLIDDNPDPHVYFFTEGEDMKCFEISHHKLTDCFKGKLKFMGIDV